jgi:1-acyl-sn-glycerol-3-phosphate acyltransferase
MEYLNTILRYLWFACVVKPAVLLGLGVNIRSKGNLRDLQKQCIIVANHNSHLDTLVLMSLFPLGHIRKVRPVAAADYFLKTKFLAWFALEIIGILPLQRRPKDATGHPLQVCFDALDRGDTLILFPEGSRGEPEQMTSFKTGIAHLAKYNSHIPLIPIFIHGLGKALPKGECVLVPFSCDIAVGDPLHWNGDRNRFMQQLKQQVDELAEAVDIPPWE